MLEVWGKIWVRMNWSLFNILNIIYRSFVFYFCFVLINEKYEEWIGLFFGKKM